MRWRRSKRLDDFIDGVDDRRFAIVLGHMGGKDWELTLDGRGLASCRLVSDWRLVFLNVSFLLGWKL